MISLICKYCVCVCVCAHILLLSRNQVKMYSMKSIKFKIYLKLYYNNPMFIFYPNTWKYIDTVILFLSKRHDAVHLFSSGAVSFINIVCEVIRRYAKFT